MLTMLKKIVSLLELARGGGTRIKLYEAGLHQKHLKGAVCSVMR